VKSLLKSLLRPAYHGLVRAPVMQRIIQRELRAMAVNPWSAGVITDFIDGDAGSAYGVTSQQKRDLVCDFQGITEQVQSGTAPIVHVVLAQAILSISPEVNGDVVECGVWKGASSASLSRVCALSGRRLKLCDSFEGLPDDGLKVHKGLHTGVYGYYKEGMFKGALEAVKENIRRHGNPEVCDYVEGFFSESLAALKDPVCFAFLDVDLESSMRDCLRAIWPLLIENGAIYSDDAGDLDVVRVFFDDPWWRKQLGCDAPGLVGSGCGLPLSASYSSLGYTRKLSAFRKEDWKKADFLYYPDSS
jgi:O-methyltransferase